MQNLSRSQAGICFAQSRNSLCDLQSPPGHPGPVSWSQIPRNFPWDPWTPRAAPAGQGDIPRLLFLLSPLSSNLNFQLQESPIFWIIQFFPFRNDEKISPGSNLAFPAQRIPRNSPQNSPSSWNMNGFYLRKTTQVVLVGYKSPFIKPFLNKTKKFTKENKRYRRNELLNIFQKGEKIKEGTQFQHAEQ